LEQVYSNYKEISIISLGSAEPNSYVLAPSWMEGVLSASTSKRCT
jgi:hypothetical protein